MAGENISRNRIPAGNNGTVVIDNGSSEFRIGYLGSSVLAKFKNRFFKSKDQISFDFMNGYTEKFMFDNDVITNFENMEVIFDHGFAEIGLSGPEGLIVTEKPFMPNFSRRRIVETAFEVYGFGRLQLGADSVYSMHKNRVAAPVLVLSLSNSCVDAILVESRIERVFKMNFGAKHCRKYTSMLLGDKYSGQKISDEDVCDFLRNLRACEEYDSECRGIVDGLRTGRFMDDYFPEFLDACGDDGKSPPVSSTYCGTSSDAAPGPSRGARRVNSVAEKDAAREDTSLSGGTETSGSGHSPERRTSGTNDSAYESGGAGSLLESSETSVSDIEHVDVLEEKELQDSGASMARTGERHGEKKDRIAYFSLIYRLKQRIAKGLERMSENIDACAENYEVKTDFHGYLERMKAKVQSLKRDLKRRDNILRELKNKKSAYSRVKSRGFDLGTNSPEEETLSQVLWAEDEDSRRRTLSELDNCIAVVQSYEPGYEPFEPPTTRFLCGVAIERRKIPEILFEPSIINMNGFGISEILEALRPRHIFLTGGFSQIAGLAERLLYEAQPLVSDAKVVVSRASDPVYDAFYGACFSPLYPAFTKQDYEELGAEILVGRMEF